MASNDKIVIDQFFAIPAGAEEVFTQVTSPISDGNDEALAAAAGDEDFQSVLEAEAEVIDYGDSTDEVTLQTPDDFVIFNQTLRRGPGGQQVVDVVVSIEDVPGATSYEVRVTKQ